MKALKTPKRFRPGILVVILAIAAGFILTVEPASAGQKNGKRHQCRDSGAQCRKCDDHAPRTVAVVCPPRRCGLLPGICRALFQPCPGPARWGGPSRAGYVYPYAATTYGGYPAYGIGYQFYYRPRPSYAYTHSVGYPPCR